MKRKTKAMIIIMILITILSIQIQTNYTYATDVVDPDDYEPSVDTLATNYEVIIDKIITIIRNVGIVVAVIALMIIGIKYLVGSVEERAEYKKSIPGYLLGVFLVVAMTTIPSIIYNIAVTWA